MLLRRSDLDDISDCRLRSICLILSANERLVCGWETRKYHTYNVPEDLFNRSSRGCCKMKCSKYNCITIVRLYNDDVKALCDGEGSMVIGNEGVLKDV